MTRRLRRRPWHNYVAWQVAGGGPQRCLVCGRRRYPAWMRFAWHHQ